MSQRRYAWTMMLLVAGCMVGEPGEIEGELEVVIEDHGDHAISRHYLITEDHGRIPLTYRGEPSELSGGTRVRLRGEWAGEALTLDDGDPTTIEVMQAALPYTKGEQRTAVILVNFQDDTSQPITPAAANSLVFTTVGNYYREASFQQTWLTGQTFGWYTVPLSETTCDYYAISAAADQAAAASGVDLSAFPRKVYMFPRNACPWAGIANVGGSNTRAWINGSFSLLVVGHELGHNLGLQHARSRDCGSVTLGTTCTVYPYGDAIDIMGNSRAGHFSPFQKELLGWLDDPGVPPLHTASTSGRYVIEPYSSASTGPKAIKIQRGTFNDKPLWYFLEYRQPIGADTVLGSTGNVTRGVMLRLATDGDASSSELLDTTPMSSAGSVSDFSDGALEVGRSYSEAAAGVTISVAWADATGAAVDVTLGGSAPTCTRAAPTLTLSGGTAAVEAGTSVSYVVTVTNHDSSGCASSSFTLSRAVPGGWTGSLAASSVTASPGASATTTLTVTSPATTGAGTYPITVSANGAGGSGSASATYTVGTPVVLSATVSTDKTSYVRGETIYMTARVLDGAKAVAGASVTFRVTKANGKTTSIAATTDTSGYARASLRVSKGREPLGTWTLHADAAYQGSTASATTSFVVH